MHFSHGRDFLEPRGEMRKILGKDPLTAEPNLSETGRGEPGPFESSNLIERDIAISLRGLSEFYRGFLYFSPLRLSLSTRAL